MQQEALALLVKPIPSFLVDLQLYPFIAPPKIRITIKINPNLYQRQLH
jgi:hypothetical protein